MIESYVTSFWSFVIERQRIYDLRATGAPRPWTTDPVLASEHFTNVYRWLDPGTQYAMASMATMNRHDAIFFDVAYRMVNRLGTMKAFGRPPTCADYIPWREFIAEMYATKQRVCTHRHLTPHRAQYDLALREALAVKIPESGSPDIFKAVTSLTGCGRFIGWQIYADLSYAPHVVHVDPDFVVTGDGASFALLAMLGQFNFADYAHTRQNRMRAKVSATRLAQYSEMIVELRDTQPRDGLPFGRLSVIDIEHALCEWCRWSVKTLRMREKA